MDGTISSLSTEVGERVASTGSFGGAEVHARGQSLPTWKSA